MIESPVHAPAVATAPFRQPNSSLPNVPLKPAPWNLTGQGWAIVVKLAPNHPARDAFVHPSLRGQGKGRYGIVMFVDYAASDCGPYHELLFIPGNFRFADGRRHTSISRIVVSSWDSVVNGRINWGIGKDRADFEVEYGVGEGREDQIVVRDGERTMAELRLKSFPVSVPVSTSMAPLAARTLAQRFEGTDYVFAPSTTAWLQPGKLVSWRFDAELFPDLSGARVVAAAKLTSFNMVFPVASKVAVR